MMKTPLRSLTCAGILGACLGAAPAMAYPGADHGPGHGPGFGLGAMGAFERVLHIADELELTDVQREDIRAILAEARTSIRPLTEALRENHQAIRQTDDAAAIEALAADQGQLVSQLVVAGYEVRSQVRAVLTPEQQALAEEMRAERHARRGGHRFGRRHGDG